MRNETAGDTGSAILRQWSMLRAIPRSPLKVSTAEIADRLADEGFHVSRRTVERDLHALSGQFPLVLDDRSKPYGWSWAKSANFEFAPRLTASEAVALLLAQAHLRHLIPVAMHKDLAPLFRTARAVLATTGWKDWARRTAVIPVALGLGPPEVDPHVLAAVQGGMTRRRCLSGRYRAKGSAAEQEMMIHPLGLLARGPSLYLVCTLFDYEDVRQLALHRMSHVKVLPAPCKLPAGFSLGSYLVNGGANLLSRGTIKLVCRFDGAAAEHLAETPLSSDQTWTRKGGDGGFVEVTATVEDDERLRWWLLGFGSQVEVLEPPSLREYIAQELRLAADRYRG